MSPNDYEELYHRLQQGKKILELVLQIQLRVVELSKEGFSVVELGNPLPHVSKEQSNNAYQHNKVETVQQLLESLLIILILRKRVLEIFLLLILRVQLFIIRHGMILLAKHEGFISISTPKNCGT